MLKLLLAEDEALERKFLRQVIQESDLPVSIAAEARDGDEAVELSRRVQPDLLLMDVKMPGLDGLAATRVIKRELPRTAVIIISAYEEFSFAWEALKLGACEYLLKPVDSEEVLGALQVALAQQEAAARGSCPQAKQGEQLSRPHLEAGLVWDLISGRAHPAQVRSRQQLLGVSLQPAAVMAVEAPHAAASASLSGPGEVSSIQASPGTREAWEAELEDHASILKAWIGENRLAVIAGPHPEASLHEQSPTRVLQDVQQRLEVQFGPLCSGTSPEVSGPQELGQAFARALEELDARCRQRQFQERDTAIKQALRYLEDNFSQPLTLEDVARHAHVSPFHLSRLIKQETGLTFVEYLTRLRTSRAKILLRSTDYPVKAIGRQVGFPEPGYFSKVFSKCEGISPSRYRRLFAEAARTEGSP